MPILTVFTSFFSTTSEYYELLKNTFLIKYIVNSVIILTGVLALTFLFGVLSAYFVSFYNFPGVNFFKWAFILSFAVPAYIYAYSLTAFFENYGTAFTILTNIFGQHEYNKFIPKFDGILGSIISMSFSLFAYVYVLTRASFYYQSQNLIEVGKNLGFTSKKSFFKIILPSARPAIIAGLSLVAMECLSDFGTVSFFSISTLTTGIYNAWISFDDLNTANQLSFILLIFILALFLIENYSRGDAKYHQPSRGIKSIPKIELKEKKSFFAVVFCSLLLFFSFLFPVSQMVYWTLKFPKYLQDLPTRVHHSHFRAVAQDVGRRGVVHDDYRIHGPRLDAQHADGEEGEGLEAVQVPAGRGRLRRRLHLPARALEGADGAAAQREVGGDADVRARVQAREEPRGARQGAAQQEEAGRSERQEGGRGRRRGEGGAVGEQGQQGDIQGRIRRARQKLCPFSPRWRLSVRLGFALGEYRVHLGFF